MNPKIMKHQATKLAKTVNFQLNIFLVIYLEGVSLPLYSEPYLSMELLRRLDSLSKRLLSSLLGVVETLKRLASKFCRSSDISLEIPEVPEISVK